MENSKQEFFDVVDENDNFLSGVIKPREQVHKELLDWHRVTVVWIINKKKQFLCQQRSLKKDVHPGMWQLNFGGHVKSGETYEANITNELAEELGLHPSISELVSIGYSKNSEQKHHSKLFVFHWDGNINELVFTDGEVDQVKWISAQDYQDMIDKGINAYRINPKILEYIQTI
jgi:16S rRNA (adenine1518-N6/adenine1519-N6)-dimethyltransferase